MNRPRSARETLTSPRANSLIGPPTHIGGGRGIPADPRSAFRCWSEADVADVEDEERSQREKTASGSGAGAVLADKYGCPPSPPVTALRPRGRTDTPPPQRTAACARAAALFVQRFSVKSFALCSPVLAELYIRGVAVQPRGCGAVTGKESERASSRSARPSLHSPREGEERRRAAASGRRRALPRQGLGPQPRRGQRGPGARDRGAGLLSRGVVRSDSRCRRRLLPTDTPYDGADGLIRHPVHGGQVAQALVPGAPGDLRPEGRVEMRPVLRRPL